MFLDIDSIGMSNQDFADYRVDNEPSENWEGCVCARERERERDEWQQCVGSGGLLTGLWFCSFEGLKKDSSFDPIDHFGFEPIFGRDVNPSVSP